MKVTKYYENNLVKICIDHAGAYQIINLRNDREIKRLGECLIDLERTGGNQVEITPPKE